MSEKSIDSYTYLGALTSEQTATSKKMTFSLGDQSITFDSLYNMEKTTQSMTLSEQGGTTEYSWAAASSAGSTKSKNNSLNNSNGLVAGGEMTDMMNMPSIIGADYAISYGFYDAAVELGNLLKDHQCYAYYTDSQKNWMQHIVGGNSIPFHQFVLPGVHDAGMNTLATCAGILKQAPVAKVEKALNKICPALHLGTDIVNEALLAIRNIAITQKDTFTTMLDLGIRYFDFRPGKLQKEIQSLAPEIAPDTLFHQHNFIPGAKYEDFLTEVLSWLKTNPNEIVVISCNTQGMRCQDMYPTPGELDTALKTARKNANVSKDDLVAGDQNDLNQTYNELITAKTRLIFLNQIGSNAPMKKYDSYNDNLYGTMDPSNVINALNAMNKTTEEEQVTNEKGELVNKYTYTVLQIQDTATNEIKRVTLPSLLTNSLASSPLMSTKGKFDHVTLPWLLEKVNANLSNKFLTIVLNDFGDNATVSYCIEICKQRMDL